MKKIVNYATWRKAGDDCIVYQSSSQKIIAEANTTSLCMALPDRDVAMEFLRRCPDRDQAGVDYDEAKKAVGGPRPWTPASGAVAKRVLPYLRDTIKVTTYGWRGGAYLTVGFYCSIATEIRKHGSHRAQ